ncbi:hypothetical protein V1507DRAFT_461970 [Lipomyces tetrasporus]
MNKPGSNNDSGNHKGIDRTVIRRNRQRPKKLEVTCYYCEGAGHIQRNCPHKDEQCGDPLH